MAAVTTHNMEVMLKELQASGELAKQGGTVWLKTDGCAKQYKCGKAFYLLCKLAEKLNVTIDHPCGSGNMCEMAIRSYISLCARSD